MNCCSERAQGQPRRPPCNHRVGEDDQLSGASHQRDLVFLSCGTQSLVHRHELRIVKKRCRQRCRVHPPAHPLAAAADVTVTVTTAAVIVIGRKPDQGSNLLAAEPADLGNAHQDDNRRLQPDAVDAGNQVEPRGKIAVLADRFLQQRNLGAISAFWSLPRRAISCFQYTCARGSRQVSSRVLQQAISSTI